MKKRELIKGILELGQKLEKAEGLNAILIIEDMESLIDEYTFGEDISTPRCECKREDKGHTVIIRCEGKQECEGDILPNGWKRLYIPKSLLNQD